MKTLRDNVQIARRFQRSININADIGNNVALEGFICPKSSQHVLEHMAHQVEKSRQGAFTWTGPYGSGKSSLAVALSAVLCGAEATRVRNSDFIGKSTSEKLWRAFPPKSKGWKVIPVVGRRDDPIKTIGDAIEQSEYISIPEGGWTASTLIEAIIAISVQQPRSSGGLILFVDEMGKFLESAARHDHDVYFFQELAEVASRSNGRLLVIGVLHQAFQEYANRLSRELRDEWSKIQGRFVDLIVDASGQEQIDLISRAIESKNPSDKSTLVATKIAEYLALNIGANKNSIETVLKKCWPLHPVVACLLGPISRRRFGQNQRSIFGFLNSAEHHAFQEFLDTSTNSDLYYPEDLWNYLRANLEPAILASPDGHRWSMAIEALERCEGLSEDEFVVNTLKTISLIDLFKERSGIKASREILTISMRNVKNRKVSKALQFLQKNSLVIFRNFQNSFGIYAGSDFDIEREVEKARGQLNEVDFDSLSRISGIQPILAKRHYHKTGALRWFDVRFCSVSSAAEEVQSFQIESGATGQILLTIPTNGESHKASSEVCRKAGREADHANVFIGVPANGTEVGSLAVDLTALDRVRRNSPELSGDSVARRELDSRISNLQQSLSDAIHAAFETSTWFLKNHPPRKSLSRVDLNKWISECCNDWYRDSPIIKNELLNRRQPSSSAIAAQNQLLRLMTQNAGVVDLGIEGFPAEAGLLHAILIRTNLYRNESNKWTFATLTKHFDTANLDPAWNAAKTFLNYKNGETIRLDKLYSVWQKPPFGIAPGLLPILAVAFLMSNSKSIAFYREGLFRPEISDLDVEYLARDPSDVQVRWMNLTGNSKKLLSGLATVIQEIRPSDGLLKLKPIDVARQLVAIHDELPGWVKRTQRLSSNTLQVRRLLNQARDPNEFLFRDLPKVLQQGSSDFETKNIEQLVQIINVSLKELTNAYADLIARLRNLLFEELEVPNASSHAMKELRNRAKNVIGIAGDFIIEAFSRRIAEFDDSEKSIESIASMAANKPVNNWVDQDVQKAMVEIAAFCRAFCRAESYAHVAGRVDKRQAMSVVVGVNGKQKEYWGEFDVKDTDRKAVTKIIQQVRAAIDIEGGDKTSLVLAALAEITAEYLQTQPVQPKKPSSNNRAA